MRRVWISLPIGPFLAVVIGCSFAHCADPTQLLIEITTDVPCDAPDGGSHFTEVGVTVGPPGTTASAEPTSTARCEGGRTVGTLAVRPTGDKNAEVSILAMMPIDGRGASECVPARNPSSTGCIPAKRQLRFLPNHTLTVKIELNDICKQRPCTDTTTCVNGQCVSDVVDPNACARPEGCALAPPAPPSGTGIVWPADCGPMDGFEPGSPWPMEGGCPSRRRRSPLALTVMPARQAWSASVGLTVLGGLTILGELLVAANGDVIAMEAAPTSVRPHRVHPNGTVESYLESSAQVATGMGALEAEGALVVPATDRLARWADIRTLGLATPAPLNAVFTGGIALGQFEGAWVRYAVGAQGNTPTLYRVAQGGAVTSVSLLGTGSALGSVPLVLANGDVVVGTHEYLRFVTPTGPVASTGANKDLAGSVFGRESTGPLVGWHPTAGIGEIVVAQTQSSITLAGVYQGPAIADDDTLVVCLSDAIRRLTSTGGFRDPVRQTPIAPCSQVTLDAQGLVLVAKDKDLFVLDPKDLTVERARVPMSEVVVAGSSIVIAPNNRIYVRTASQVLAFDP